MEREFISGNSKELIEKLGERWNVGKATIYKRLESLQITISKANGESFIYSHELSTLDELNEWIKAGNTLATFPKSGALVQSEGQEISATFNAEIDQTNIEFEPMEVEEGHQVRQLVRTAQEKAAGLLMAQNMLAAQFKDNPHMMDEDLQQQIKQTEEAIAPKSINPLQYANNLMNKFTQIAA